MAGCFDTLCLTQATLPDIQFWEQQEFQKDFRLPAGPVPMEGMCSCAWVLSVGSLALSAVSMWGCCGACQKALQDAVWCLVRHWLTLNDLLVICPKPRTPSNSCIVYSLRLFGCHLL